MAPNVKVVVYDRNARVPNRKPNYWLRYYVDGAEVREAAKPSKKQSLEYAAHTSRVIDSGAWVPPKDRKRGRHLFENYALEVIDRRVRRGIKTANKDERGHVENHLAKLFSGLRVDDLTFRLIRDAFDGLRSKGDLAPRTIRNIHATLRAILIEAVEDELVSHIPTALTSQRGHLPPPVDPDGTGAWREKAVFTREEVARLASCDGIPINRRALYVTLFLSGPRIGELLAANCRDYDRRPEPLGAIRYIAEKGGRQRGVVKRVVPVHPELAAWLNWWLDEGYELVHGQRPDSASPLFPTASLRRQRQGHTRTSQAEIYKQCTRNDLPVAGLRARRIHDARRTFVSIARSDQLDRAMVRSVTHRAIEDLVIDGYTTYEWRALCAAISSVEWGVPAPSLEPRTPMCEAPPHGADPRENKG